MSNKKKYYSFYEAREVIQRLNITSSSEYFTRYKEDDRLPSSPKNIYSDYWVNWNHFLGKKIRRYKSYEEAKFATQLLNISSFNEYRVRYKEDPLLPSSPHIFYKESWISWRDFLGHFYESIESAKRAAMYIGIRDYREYKETYKYDPKLPSSPFEFYSECWLGWNDFLEVNSEYYKSFSQAKTAVQKLGIRSKDAYEISFTLDNRLPRYPNEIYADNWISWSDFLEVSPQKYLSFESAKMAVVQLKITSIQDYRNKYFNNKMLPPKPEKTYADYWLGWDDFLSIIPKYYNSYLEAKLAVQHYGFKSRQDYLSFKELDVRLPRDPDVQYKSDWISWEEFLSDKPIFYASYAEARAAAISLGFKNREEYIKGYKIDSRLTGNPQIIYAKEWVSWSAFLNDESTCYETYSEARIAAQKLHVCNKKSYLKRYRFDPKLPKDPKTFYKNDWKNWNHFLTPDPEYYSNYEEARLAVHALGFKSKKEYYVGFKIDLKLPRNPNEIYLDDWLSWKHWFTPDLCDSYVKAKTLAHLANFLSVKNYQRRYKELDKNLPINPDIVFKSDWVDWYDYLGIEKNTFYSYEEASRHVQENGILNFVEYSKYRINSKNSKLYAKPEDHYEDWINWHVFLGKEEPYQIEYIRGNYLPWKEAISEFMEKARGGDSKVNILCKFVRLYIEKNNLGFSPIDILTAEYVNQDLFDLFLDSSFALHKKSKAVLAINELLNYIVRTKLTFEDEETGELARLSGARNPFDNMSVEKIAGNKPRETVKPLLQFAFLQAARNWIIPPTAKSFSDLTHLYENFDSDWQLISPELMDENDKDAIFKVLDDGTVYIWAPINWLHTYVLMELPLRGVQIAYNDSGEGDLEIPDIDDNGKIFWKINDGPLAGQTNRQSMVSKLSDSSLGYFVTSNKTSENNSSYSVPWIPENVAYWLIKLRRWQAKYNPISTATPWSTCTRTNLNKTQLEAKGRNCFLFRGYGQVEAISFSGILADRIAVSLFHTQKNITLATCQSRKYRSVSHYKTEFSPHSLRVGLITAFLFEYGLPIEIIMKIVGHSTILMTIYYVKIGSRTISQRMEEGEKRALQNATHSIQRQIEQQKIDAVKNELISNSKDILNLLNNQVLAANFTFSDIGICPYANSKCDEGGSEIKNMVFAPVPQGHLGTQNCIRCRFFVTGPAYLGGLVALFHQINFFVGEQINQSSSLSHKMKVCKQELYKLDEEKYECQAKKVEFLAEARYSQIEQKIGNLKSEHEGVQKKLDLYLCDLQSIYRIVTQCRDLLNNHNIEGASASDKIMLIKHSSMELVVELEETSAFHQLSEICENAVIYDSVNASFAISPRSQMLDKMADLNNIKPFLYKLTQQEQLIVGNQMTKLILARLQSWERVSDVIEGRLQLADLTDCGQVLKHEIETLSNEATLQISNL